MGLACPSSCERGCEARQGCYRGLKGRRCEVRFVRAHVYTVTPSVECQPERSSADARTVTGRLGPVQVQLEVQVELARASELKLGLQMEVSHCQRDPDGHRLEDPLRRWVGDRPSQ
jgi:hypothetical protein